MTTAAPDALVDRGVCPLCGDDDGEVHLDFPDIPVRRCRRCGFMFSGRILPPDALTQYYEQSFGSDRHRKGQIVNARVNAAALTALGVPGPDHRVLDVGAGYGFLVKTLRERGVDAHGVEPSTQEATHARDELNLPVRPGLLADAGFEQESFDLVMCFEVIEHLDRPVPFVAELATYVRPGGRLLVMTDNFESAVVRRMGPRWPKWIPHSHVSHFAPTTLEACIERAAPLTVEKRLSYTPWENVLAAQRARLRAPADAKDAYDLEQVLATEMGGAYRLFALRKMLNVVWFGLTRRSDLRGALMYALARKGLRD
jgi:SAM-dependent methyltransferase